MTTPPSTNTPNFSVPTQQQLLNWRAELPDGVRQNIRNYIHSKFVSICSSVSSEILKSRAYIFENKVFACAMGRANYFQMLTNGLERFQQLCIQKILEPSQRPSFSTPSSAVPHTEVPTQVLHQSPPSVQEKVDCHCKMSAQGPSCATDHVFTLGQVPDQAHAPNQTPSTCTVPALMQEQYLPLQNFQATQVHSKPIVAFAQVGTQLQQAQPSKGQVEATRQIEPSSAQKPRSNATVKRKPSASQTRKNRNRKKGQATQASVQYASGAASRGQNTEQLASPGQNFGFCSGYIAEPPHNISLAENYATLQRQQQHDQVLNSLDSTCARPNKVTQELHASPAESLGSVPSQPLNTNMQTGCRMQAINIKAGSIAQGSVNGTMNAMISEGGSHSIANVTTEQINGRALAEELVRHSAQATGVLLTQEQISGLSSDQIRRILDIVIVRKTQSDAGSNLNSFSSPRRVPAISTASATQWQGPGSFLQNKYRISSLAPALTDEAQCLSRGQVVEIDEQYGNTKFTEPQKRSPDIAAASSDVAWQLHRIDNIDTQALTCSMEERNIAMIRERFTTTAEGCFATEKQIAMSDDEKAQASQIENIQAAGFNGIAQNFRYDPSSACQASGTDLCTEKVSSMCERAISCRNLGNEPTTGIDGAKDEYQKVVKLTEIQRSFKPAMLRMRPVVRRMCDRYSPQHRTMFIKGLGECWSILNISCNFSNNDKTFVSTPSWLTLSLLMKVELYMSRLLRTAVNILRNRKYREQNRSRTTGGKVSAAQRPPTTKDLNLPVTRTETAMTGSGQSSLHSFGSNSVEFQPATKQRQLYLSQVQDMERINESTNVALQTNVTMQMQLGTPQKIREDQSVLSRVKSQTSSQGHCTQIHEVTAAAKFVPFPQTTLGFSSETRSLMDVSSSPAYTWKVPNAKRSVKNQQAVQDILVSQRMYTEISSPTECHRESAANRVIECTTPKIQEKRSNLFQKAESLSNYAENVEACTKMLEEYITAEIKDHQRKRLHDTIVSIGMNQSWRKRRSKGTKRPLEGMNISNYSGNKVIKSKCLFECSTEDGLMLARKKIKWTDTLRIVEEDCNAVRDCFPAVKVAIEEEFGFPLVKCTLENKFMQLPVLIIRLDRGYPRSGGTRYGFERPAMGWIGVLADIKERFQYMLQTGSARYVGVSACLYAWADAVDTIINKSCT